MAYLSHQPSYPIRSSHKEPSWASVYDDLFDQYVDTDRFDFGSCNAAASSSDEASNETIASIERLTDSGESSSSEARRQSDDFWARTLQMLEESAAQLEQSEQRERQTPPALYTKDHPHSDFLSLGGFPSPHISSSPTSPSEAARRRRAARYQSDRPDRPIGKPVGITKANRSSSRSPKMMSPSRYRAGAQDGWAEGIYRAHSMVTMNLPVRSMPLSPPPSTKSKHVTSFSGFCSPQDIDAAPFQPFIPFDEQVSPFSNTFPRTIPIQLQSPHSSPLTTPGVERGALLNYNFEATTFREVCYEPADQFNKASWTANSFAAEDIYEPSPTFSPWMVSEAKQVESQADHQTFADYSCLHNVPGAKNGMATSGLMISYDPTLLPSREEQMEAMEPSVQPHYIATEPRLPRRETRTPSLPRRQHRTPSSKGHSRKTSGQQSPRASKSGFVNYTASDSEKLLMGVAPSGSSKTKARREKEAAEKRRRFSQAAVKAVVEAGGNLAKLRDSGLFVS